MTPKHIGLDVHQATISAAVLHSKTKAAAILQFVQGYLQIGKDLRRRQQIIRYHVTTQTCQPRP